VVASGVGTFGAGTRTFTATRVTDFVLFRCGFTSRLIRPGLDSCLDAFKFLGAFVDFMEDQELLNLVAEVSAVPVQ
jgi:hypothetical protein